MVSGQFQAAPRGKTSTCRKAMDMPMKPSTEPTERSMWRATMTSTMPVAMMPTAEP